jgi:hypothetical protein
VCGQPNAGFHKAYHNSLSLLQRAQACQFLRSALLPEVSFEDASSGGATFREDMRAITFLESA